MGKAGRKGPETESRAVIVRVRKKEHWNQHSKKKDRKWIEMTQNQPTCNRERNIVSPKL